MKEFGLFASMCLNMNTHTNTHTNKKQFYETTATHIALLLLLNKTHNVNQCHETTLYMLKIQINS